MIRCLQAFSLITIVGFTVVIDVLPNTMITNTQYALDTIRTGVLHDAKKNKKLMKMPALMVKMGMIIGKYDAQMRSNADIVRPFFTIKNATHCLRDIGSEQEDIDYLQSVFTELNNSNDYTLYQLVNILHRHMMEALGFPITKTLDQFKHMLEKTNKKGYPTLFDHDQFMIYCRCVARGLYAVYWFENGYC